MKTLKTGPHSVWDDLMNAYFFSTEKDAVFEVKESENVVWVHETIYIVES